MDNIRLYQGDCLELMKNIPDGEVDLILCDLPYGTTACKWDSVIPFELLWAQYKRIIKDNGAIVLFGAEPFSSKLRLSNLKMYKYDWIWKKHKGTGFLNANRQPLRDSESISVFYKRQCIYNPQFTPGTPYDNKEKAGKKHHTDCYRNYEMNTTVNCGKRYPKQIIAFGAVERTVHPTQKPVALLEYLLNTYTNAGDTVLDNCMGSGSTGVACVNTGRKFIGMELDAKYFEIARQRIAQAGEPNLINQRRAL